MSAAPPGHEYLTPFWVVMKKPGKVHCQFVYGRGRKAVRKAIEEKLKGTPWKLTYCKATIIPEYSPLWYDENS